MKVGDSIITLELNNWYKLHLANDTYVIFHFQGEDDDGLIMVDCDGDRMADFRVFRAIEDLGEKSPC